MTIPDAPYIVEAERDGYPSREPVTCPCCGEECETIYADQYGNVFGCEQCVMTQDADEWAEEQREAEREEFEEHNRTEE